MTKVKKVSIYIAKLGVLGVLFWLLFILFFIAVFSFGNIGLILIPLEIWFFIFCTMRLDILGKDEKTKGRKRGYRFLFSLPLLIPSVLLGLALFFHETVSDKIEDYNEHRLSGIYYSQADEFIDIDDSAGKAAGGLMGTPLSNSTIMIDYDEMRVSFVLNGSWEELQTYVLSKKASNFSRLRLQSEKSLSSPGKTFRSYYIDSQLPHLTSGIEIEMENGDIWRAKMDKARLHIDNEFPLIDEAYNNYDEIIEYLDAELPANEADIKHPSILFDYDAMYAYLIYDKYGRDCFLQDFKLTEYNYKAKGIPEMELDMKIEMKSPWKEVYICNRVDELHNHPHGVILISEDNKMYFGEAYVTGVSQLFFEDSEYAFKGDQHDIEKSLGIS